MRDKVKVRNTKRTYQLRMRARVIDAMGGACACCGEREPKFLAIDHVRGLEGQPRPKGQMIYFLVRKEGYPRDKYQLLCHNCNFAKGVYGACPHGGAGSQDRRNWRREGGTPLLPSIAANG